MKIIDADYPVYHMEHAGVEFDVILRDNEWCIVGDWAELSGRTNTHPEELLDLIDNEVYNYRRSRQHA